MWLVLNDLFAELLREGFKFVLSPDIIPSVPKHQPTITETSFLTRVRNGGRSRQRAKSTDTINNKSNNTEHVYNLAFHANDLVDTTRVFTRK